MSEVEYRDIEGFPGYRVGDDGSVWSKVLRGGKVVAGQPLRFGEWRLLKPTMKKWRGCKHLYVNLTRGSGDDKRVYVHTLVLEAFVGPKPEGTECCHANDLGDDNRLENLRWDTHLANASDKVKNGNQHQGEDTPNSVLKETQVADIRTRYAAGEKQSTLANEFGVCRGVISQVCRGETWKHVVGPIFVREKKGSKYKGVRSSPGSKKNPWRATIRVKGKSINLGNFKTEEAASAAYEAAVLKYRTDSVI